MCARFPPRHHRPRDAHQRESDSPRRCRAREVAMIISERKKKKKLTAGAPCTDKARIPAAGHPPPTLEPPDVEPRWKKSLEPSKRGHALTWHTRKNNVSHRGHDLAQLCTLREKTVADDQAASDSERRHAVGGRLRFNENVLFQ